MLILFVVLGATWSVGTLAVSAVAALALLAARYVAKTLVLVATARIGGIDMRQGLALGMTLTPLSATTLVLLADLQATHPETASQIAPIVLAAIAMMALAGPVVVQWGLRLTGDYRPQPVTAPRGRWRRSRCATTAAHRGAAPALPVLHASLRCGVSPG